MRTLKVDIEGLDLVLGGGIRLLERLEGCGESTTLLIRGPAGSGKTVLGTQLASSIARALETDVAYGCIELLPTELRAQHKVVRTKKAREQVVILTEEGPEPDDSHVRIYAGLLDLGEGEENVERFGGALESLLSAATERAGREVRVLVVDSLSVGYGLGADAPRILADGVSKLAAERGLVVILLEEQADERSSVWSFAVDMVFELLPALVEIGPSRERRFLVPKSRLGPSDPGPHEFLISSEWGVTIRAREAAYQKPWTYDVLRGEKPLVEIKQPWHPGEFKNLKWLPEFRRSTVAVVGQDSAAVRELALRIGHSEPPEELADVLGPEIEFGIGLTGSSRPSSKSRLADPEARIRRLSWGPLQAGPSILSSLRANIERQRARGKHILRVIIGDLSNIRHYGAERSMMLTISTAAALLRDLDIPLILYETTESPHSGTAAGVNANILVTHLGSEDNLTHLRIDKRWGAARSEFISLKPPVKALRKTTRTPPS